MKTLFNTVSERNYDILNSKQFLFQEAQPDATETTNEAEKGKEINDVNLKAKLALEAQKNSIVQKDLTNYLASVDLDEAKNNLSQYRKIGDTYVLNVSTDRKKLVTMDKDGTVAVSYYSAHESEIYKVEGVVTAESLAAGKKTPNDAGYQDIQSEFDRYLKTNCVGKCFAVQNPADPTTETTEIKVKKEKITKTTGSNTDFVRLEAWEVKNGCKITKNSTLSQAANSLGSALKQGDIIVVIDENGERSEYAYNLKNKKVYCQTGNCSWGASTAPKVYEGQYVFYHEGKITVSNEAPKDTFKTVTRTEYSFVDASGKEILQPEVEAFLTEYNAKNGTDLAYPTTTHEWQSMLSKKLSYTTESGETVLISGKKLDLNAFAEKGLEAARITGAGTTEQRAEALKNKTQNAKKSIENWDAKVEEIFNEKGETSLKRITQAVNNGQILGLDWLSADDGLLGVATGIINVFLKKNIGGENAKLKQDILANRTNYENKIVQALKKGGGMPKTLGALISVVDRFALPILGLASGVLHLFDVKLGNAAEAVNLRDWAKQKSNVIEGLDAYKSNLDNAQLNPLYLKNTIDSNLDVDDAVKKLEAQLAELKVDESLDESEQNLMTKLGLSIDKTGKVYAKDSKRMWKAVFGGLFNGRNTAESKAMREKMELLGVDSTADQEERLIVLREILDIAKAENAQDIFDRDLKGFSETEKEALAQLFMNKNAASTDVSATILSVLQIIGAKGQAEIGIDASEIEFLESIKDKKESDITKQDGRTQKRIFRKLFKNRFVKEGQRQLNGRRSMLVGVEDNLNHLEDLMDKEDDLNAERVSLEMESGADKLKHSAAFNFLESYFGNVKNAALNEQGVNQILDKIEAIYGGTEVRGILKNYFLESEPITRAKYLKTNLTALSGWLNACGNKAVVLEKSLYPKEFDNLSQAEKEKYEKCLQDCLTAVQAGEYRDEYFVIRKTGSIPVIIPIALLKAKVPELNNTVGKNSIDAVEGSTGVDSMDLLGGLMGDSVSQTATNVGGNIAKKSLVDLGVQGLPLAAGYAGVHIPLDAAEDIISRTSARSKSTEKESRTASRKNNETLKVNADIISDKKAERLAKRINALVEDGKSTEYILNKKGKLVSSLASYYQANPEKMVPLAVQNVIDRVPKNPVNQKNLTVINDSSLNEAVAVTTETQTLLETEIAASESVSEITPKQIETITSVDDIQKLPFASDHKISLVDENENSLNLGKYGEFATATKETLKNILNTNNKEVAGTGGYKLLDTGKIQSLVLKLKDKE